MNPNLILYIGPAGNLFNPDRSREGKIEFWEFYWAPQAAFCGLSL
jgi:hypothetical protein